MLQQVLSPLKEDNWGGCNSLLPSPHVGVNLGRPLPHSSHENKPVCFKETTLLRSVFLSLPLVCFYSFQWKKNPFVDKDAVQPLEGRDRSSLERSDSLCLC